MSLKDRDSKVLWHPYTQMKTAAPPLGIVSGHGEFLVDEQGNEYIDAVTSWWVNIHGHSHPYIAEKVYEQLKTLEHVIFAGFTHEPAVQLAERLVDLLPTGQQRLFYSDNGSTAVEVAVKMALQYWRNKGQEREHLVAIHGSYHGDTFGAMSVSERSAFTEPFQKHLFHVQFVDEPREGDNDELLNQLEAYLQHGTVAAMIAEPMLMGVAGMKMYSAELLEAMIQLCHKYDTLFIADEVLTGFGRTGKLFACHHLDLEPDIMCLSKGITGGTMALGATTCTEEVYQAFYSDDKGKTLFHGHSFTANPVACAASLASLDLFEQEKTMEKVGIIEASHRVFAERLRQEKRITNVRVLGVVLAFEVVTRESDSYFNSQRDNLYDFFMNRGILLRPLGNTLYILPPYCISPQSLNKVYNAILELAALD